MNIDNLTFGQLKEINDMFSNSKTPTTEGIVNIWQIGKQYLIRTVTMIDTGKLIAIGDKELVLEDAAWIPDTGRFSDSLLSINFNEVEPFPNGKVIIGRGSIIDALEINNLPRDLK